MGRKRPDIRSFTKEQRTHTLEMVRVVGKFCRYVADLADCVQQSLVELERLKARSYGNKLSLPMDPFLEYLDTVEADLSQAIRRGQFLTFRDGRVKWTTNDRFDHTAIMLAKNVIEDHLRRHFDDDFEFVVGRFE